MHGKASIDVYGDILTVYWGGGVWIARTNGTQHARVFSALASELRAYLTACGEYVEHISERFVCEKFDVKYSD